MKLTLKTIAAVLFGIFFSSTIYSQTSIDRILSEIDKNNTTLITLRKSIDAEKIGNKTAIYLTNPEVELNYLWGNAGLGNRIDFSISQSFDFPSAYKYKNNISNLKNEIAELEYQKQRKILILRVRLLCSDLVYINALKAEMTKRLIQAQNLAKLYKSKYDAGETNIIEYNKSQLNFLNVSKELESIEVERTVLLSELISLNGGIKIEFNDSEFIAPLIPQDFEQWYTAAEENNPFLAGLFKEALISRQTEKLNMAMGLPKFQTGYMSESVVGQKFQGVTIGLSIPLWENKNNIKYAKANSIALESMIIDNKLQLYNQLKLLHTKAVGLQKNAIDYKQNLNLYSNSELLKKALDKGEISLIEYILEQSVYYESVVKLLELEKELNKTTSELNQYVKN